MEKHPAKYTDSFIPIFASKLQGVDVVLDPFAGTGKIGLIKEFGFNGKVFCNEIEPEWCFNKKYKIDKWTNCDAEFLPFKTGEIGAICTSPTYGNRMADKHNSKDSSLRITYTHTLGRELSSENTGCMQWGVNYKLKHEKIYVELKRVLRKEGLFILNIKDHIRKGEQMPVTSWHKNTLQSIGLILVEEIKVPVNSMKKGRNSELRVSYESILIFNNPLDAINEMLSKGSQLLLV